MIRRWHHGHSIIAGIAAGAAITHGPLGAFLLFAGGAAIGAAAAFLVGRARAAKQYVEQLVDDRERRANVNAELRRRASERADARLAMQLAKANDRAGGDFGEVPF